jgi:acetolactate synthase I/II/III large subunit
MKAAGLLVDCLENEGVRFAFGIPGEENLELMDALHDSSIRFVLTRHEEAAAFMANIHGRLTGQPGLCLATLGPGATNLVTGVADAFLDRAPLVAITAQADLSKVHRESHQFIDVLRLFGPIAKWNARVENAGTVPEIVRKAFKIATAERPGPTQVELPENVGQEEAPAGLKPLPPERASQSAPNPESVRRAAALIDRAQRPIILAGNGAIRGGAADELTAFAEKANIPVAHTFMGNGAVPWTSAVSLLTVGVQPDDHELAGFDNADLVICVGYDFVEYDPRSWNSKGDRHILHIDVLPAETSAEYIPDVEIVADIRESLESLRKNVSQPKDPVWAQRLKARVRKKLESSGAEARGRLVKPQAILKSLRETLRPEDLLVSDVGAHKIFVGRFFGAVKPNTVLVSNGLSAMGIAVPGGIAAKLLNPSRRVVTISGDGGFLMAAHELETAKRERVATVNLVFRDGGLGSIRWKQMARFGRTLGTEFGNPNFSALARAFGVRGLAVERSSDLASTLEQALESKVPCVVDIPVDYSENPFLR